MDAYKEKALSRAEDIFSAEGIAKATPEQLLRAWLGWHELTVVRLAEMVTVHQSAISRCLSGSPWGDRVAEEIFQITGIRMGKP